MGFQAGHSTNAGKVLTTRPLLWTEIQKVKEVVQDNPRDRALLSLSLGTGLRASDLVSLKWSDLEDDGERITALIRERKTAKLNRITLTQAASADVRRWKEHSTSEYVVSGQRGRMTVGSIGRLVKDWSEKAGLDTRHVASHSLRKGRCRALVDQFDEPLYKIMISLNHSSEAQTARYLGMTPKLIASLYDHDL